MDRCCKETWLTHGFNMVNRKMVWRLRRWVSGWGFHQWWDDFSRYPFSGNPSLRTNKNITFKGKADTLLFMIFIFGKHACTISTFPFNRILNSTHNQWISSIFALFHHCRSYPPTDSRPSTQKNIAGRRLSPSRGFACWFSCPNPKDFNLYGGRGFGSVFSWHVWKVYATGSLLDHDHDENCGYIGRCLSQNHKPIYPAW